MHVVSIAALTCMRALCGEFRLAPAGGLGCRFSCGRLPCVENNPIFNPVWLTAHSPIPGHQIHPCSLSHLEIGSHFSDLVGDRSKAFGVWRMASGEWHVVRSTVAFPGLSTGGKHLQLPCCITIRHLQSPYYPAERYPRRFALFA